MTLLLRTGFSQKWYCGVIIGVQIMLNRLDFIPREIFSISTEVEKFIYLKVIFNIRYVYIQFNKKKSGTYVDQPFETKLADTCLSQCLDM